MATIRNDLVLTRLGQRQLAALAAKAKRLGTTPEGYVKRLVAEDLALDRAARSTPLAGLFGPPRDVDGDAELDRLVETARAAHHRRPARKR